MGPCTWPAASELLEPKPSAREGFSGVSPLGSGSLKETAGRPPPLQEA